MNFGTLYAIRSTDRLFRLTVIKNKMAEKRFEKGFDVCDLLNSRG